MKVGCLTLINEVFFFFSTLQEVSYIVSLAPILLLEFSRYGCILSHLFFYFLNEKNIRIFVLLLDCVLLPLVT